MFLIFVCTALLLLVLYTLWKTPVLENMDDTSVPDYTPYTEEESDLLSKNESNLAALKKQMDTVLALQTQVTSIQSSCDANTQNINTFSIGNNDNTESLKNFVSNIRDNRFCRFDSDYRKGKKNIVFKIENFLIFKKYFRSLK